MSERASERDSERQRARHRLPRAQHRSQSHTLAKTGFCVARTDALVKRGAEGEEGARTRGGQKFRVPARAETALSTSSCPSSIHASPRAAQPIVVAFIECARALVGAASERGSAGRPRGSSSVLHQRLFLCAAPRSSSLQQGAACFSSLRRQSSPSPAVGPCVDASPR